MIAAGYMVDGIYECAEIAADYISKFKYKNLFLTFLFVVSAAICVLNIFYFKFPFLVMTVITFFVSVCKNIGAFPKIFNYFPGKSKYLMAASSFFIKVEERHGF